MFLCDGGGGGGGEREEEEEEGQAKREGKRLREVRREGFLAAEKASARPRRRTVERTKTREEGDLSASVLLSGNQCTSSFQCFCTA